MQKCPLVQSAFPEEVGHHSRDIFVQSDSSLNMLMANRENIPSVRILAVILSFSYDFYNESIQKSQEWLALKIFFLGKSSF